MTQWTAEDLPTLDRTDELRIAGRRADGTLRKPVIIWMVKLGDALYVRSVNGTDAAWFRGTQLTGLGQITAGGMQRDVSFTSVTDLDSELDAAYSAKYPQYPSAVASVNSAVARSATLRIDPV